MEPNLGSRVEYVQHKGGEGESDGGIGGVVWEAQRGIGIVVDDGQELKAGGINVNYLTQYRYRA